MRQKSIKRSIRCSVRLAFASLVLGGLSTLPVRSGTIYRIDQVVTFKGKAPRWDYLAFDAGRVFIARGPAGVTVYDFAAKTDLGTIDNSAGAGAITAVPEFDRGYTTNRDGSTTVFTLSTLKTIGRIKLGSGADAAYYEPVSKQLAFTMDGVLTFVDARLGTATGTLSMPSEELEAAAADGKGALFIAERDKAKVGKVDGATRKLVAEWPVTGCEQPTGVAIDAARNRLFIGCRGESPVMAVMDTSTGAIVARLPIGRGNDTVAYDTGTHRVFASNGLDANVVIYDQTGSDTYTLAESLLTRPSARTLTFDPKTKTLFTVTAEGRLDPKKARNRRSGPLAPNTYFDDSLSLLIIGPHDDGDPKSP